MERIKYKDIEYVVASLSDLDEEMRCDAEYFLGIGLNGKSFLTGKTATIFSQYGTSKELNEEGNGFPILRLNEFNDCFLGKPSKCSNLISKENYDSLQIKKKDVLICRTNGNPKLVGKAAVSMQDENYGFASYLFRIRTDENFILPEVLTTYLNSLYGRNEIEKFSMISNQANFSPAKFRKIKIPFIPISIQNIIADNLRKSYKLSIVSKQLYEEAEQMLLSELGLKNWKPKTISFKHHKVKFEVDDSITNKMFSEVIKNYRFDAEYWEPQYDEIIAAFDKFPRYKLSDLVCYPIASGATPKAGGNDYTDLENGYPFLRAVDLVDGRVNTNDLLYIKPNIHGGMLKRTQIFKNDVLLSIAGTVGRSAIFDHDFEANINQALCILRLQNEKIVKRLYLIVFFNSLIGNKYLSKTARQGLQTNLNLKEVGSLEIPVLDMKVQNKIASTVLKSFQTSDKSKFSLEISKRAVEIFIEQNEEEALKYYK